MLTFLKDLLEQGRVVVPLADARAQEKEPVDLHRMIRQLDAEARLEMAFAPPPLSIDAALWALQLIENACRFLVYRELDEDAMSAAIKPECPVRPSPQRTYSADLLLRYLPDVTRMARGIGSEDPLVKQLHRTAAHWPLSSVGIDSVVCDDKDLEPIFADPSLTQLYVDRIIEHRDTSRLVPPVNMFVKTALGAHPNLAPTLAKALDQQQEQL